MCYHILTIIGTNYYYKFVQNNHSSRITLQLPIYKNYKEQNITIK